MNTQLQASIAATATNINAILKPTRKTVVRAAKGELVLFAEYDPLLQGRAVYDEEVDVMGSPAVSH
jgi:hypothetical protein